MQSTAIPFKPIYATKEQIDLNPITNGSLYISTNTGETFFDVSGNRIQIRDIEILANEAAKTALENPIQKFYLTLAEGRLYYYNGNSGWIWINDDSIGDELEDSLENMDEMLDTELEAGTLPYDFSDYALLSANNIFTGNNTFTGNQIISGILSVNYDNNLITINSLISKINELEGQIQELRASQIKAVSDYYITVSNSINPSTINLIYELDDSSLSGIDRTWTAEGGNKILHTVSNGWEIQDSSNNTLLSCNGGTKPVTSENNPYDETWTDLNNNTITFEENAEIII